MLTHAARRIAAAGIAIAGALYAADSDAAPCGGGISPQAAKHVFDIIVKAFPATGPCEFNGVSTNMDVLQVKWLRSGHAAPPILVTVQDCDRPTGNLKVDSPPEFDACPGSQTLLTALGATVKTIAPVGRTPAKPWGAALFAALTAVTALILAVSTRARTRFIELDDRLLAKVSTADVSTAFFVACSVFIVALATAFRFSIPVKSLVEGGEIERLYRMDAFTTWQHLLSPSDAHHPGLWFALIRAPFEWSGHSVAVVELAVRLFSVLAIPVAGTLVYGYAGRIPALLAMIDVALLPVLMRESEDLSDVTLFVLLALGTLAAYRALDKPTVPRRVAFALLLGLTFHSSYAGLVLAGAIAADALFPPRRSPMVWGAIGAALVIGLPRFWSIARHLPAEVVARQDTAHLPWATWASVPFTKFLESAGVDLLTLHFLPVMGVIALALWAGRSYLAPRRVLVLTAVGYTMFLVLQPLIRIRAYYGLMLPVALIALLGSLAGTRAPEEEQVPAGRRRGAALAGLIACGVAFTAAAPVTWLNLFDRASDEDSPSALLHRLDGSPVKTLAINMGMDWTLSTWGFFSDRFKGMHECLTNGSNEPCDVRDIREADSGRRIIALTDPASALVPDWQSRALEKFQGIVKSAGQTALLLDRSFENPPLEQYARERCHLIGEARTLTWPKPIELWTCPGH